MKKQQLSNNDIDLLIQEKPYLLQWMNMVIRSIEESDIQNFELIDLLSYIDYHTKHKWPIEFKEWVHILIHVTPDQIRDYLAIRYQVLEVPSLETFNIEELF
ncbi:hypothetical protein [Atopobacter phocae]|uniref:hypothetical protein n=1 Tax=Atopobacter phocae TaxID=136492 RepID=UPI0004714E13|nr:hypothetical protein [Atopobacter phocae]